MARRGSCDELIAELKKERYGIYAVTVSYFGHNTVSNEQLREGLWIRATGSQNDDWLRY